MNKIIEYTGKYLPKQAEIFFDNEARIKVIAKGRRFGLTRGMAIYGIDQILAGEVKRALWIDTIYNNIQNYFDRYFIPELRQINGKAWNYNKTRAVLELVNGTIDFKSADKPENIEGFAYDLIIINEAGIVLRNEKLWTETILPMTLDYKAAVIIGGTPKGKRTKDGKPHKFFELFEKGKVKNEKWRSYQYSTYDNALIDPEEIDELITQIPSYMREQEIFGRFVDKAAEGIIKREWFQAISEREIKRERIIRKVQSWDTAFKKNEENDFSVCESWIITKDKYILYDVWRERVEFPELKREVLKQHNQFNPDEIIIEDKGSGQSLIQELKRETRIPVKAISVIKDKVERVNLITPLIEAGKVYLLEGAEWVNDFINECEDFPGCEHDDQADAASQFLNYAKGIRQNELGGIMHVERGRLKRRVY